MRGVRYALLLLLCLYWALILTLTHIPKPPPVGPYIGDKTEHFLAYGALGGLLFLTLWVWRPSMRRLPMVVLGICLAYGAVDEWTQPIFGRTCDLKDWLADAAASVIATGGMGMMWWYARRKAPRQLQGAGEGATMAAHE